MAIAALLNIPNTPETTAVWSFSHAAHHRDINRVIYQTQKIALPEFVLDPFDPNSLDFQNWLYLHQNMHTNQDNVLGISGFDLTDVTWSDKGQLASWIQLHENEHFQAGNILGIG